MLSSSRINDRSLQKVMMGATTTKTTFLLFLVNTILFLCSFGVVVVASATATTSSSASNNKKQSQPPPNIVFLVCESTDGRTWQKGYQNDVIPLPNLRALEAAPGGYSFHRHYSNTPVCCPSRATFWSGRHAHKIPHVQLMANKTTRRHKELAVDGVWNNYEGLPHDFDARIDQILEGAGGYNTRLSGKLDFHTGGHSDNVKLSAWTMYTRFPYDVNKNGGWRDEDTNLCGDNGTVHGGDQPWRSPHAGDWKTLNETIDWLKEQYATPSNASKQPFFVYQGMNIVHPPYVTNQYWYNKIDPQKIKIPKWFLQPNKEMHPCDYQSSQLKGCLPPLNNQTAVDWYYSEARLRNIRRIYYAMIAEFDAMVGGYMTAVREELPPDVWRNTVFIVTSDHGDMQMEHQQSYKMVPYDASSSVPMIISDNRVKDAKAKHQDKRVITTPTQLIDLYPTIMELAGISSQDYPINKLDGYSLVPLLKQDDEGGDDEVVTDVDGSVVTDENGNVVVNSTTTTTKRPNFIVSQFHGMNIAMSWFMIVKIMKCVKANVNPDAMCTYKLVVWGTGHEVDSQLFDLTHDPEEMINQIYYQEIYKEVIDSLQQDLRSVVDYPKVALNVARYNKDSMKNWMEVLGDPQWKHAIADKRLRWSTAWNADSKGAFKALEEWVNSTHDEILPCRNDLIWPPPKSSNITTTKAGGHLSDNNKNEVVKDAKTTTTTIS